MLVSLCRCYEWRAFDNGTAVMQGGTTAQKQDPAESGFLRFYYSNRRPTWFGWLSNQAWAWAAGLGLTSPIMATLQVEDRRDGRLRSTVSVPAHYEGGHYLVSMLDGLEWGPKCPRRRRGGVHEAR